MTRHRVFIKLWYQYRHTNKMAVTGIIGLILISLVQDTKAYAICYHFNSMYAYTMYVGYCTQGCCGSQCCENTTVTPDLDEGTITAIVLGSVLGFALFVAIVVIIGVCCYYKQNSRNQIETGHVLTVPQPYPVTFQGTYSHAPGYLSQFSHNHAFGVSHAHFQSDMGQHAMVERIQFLPGQRNDPPGYHPEIEMTHLNHGRQNDPPVYRPEQQNMTQTNTEEKNDPPEFEALPGPSNGNMMSAPPADGRY